MLCLASGSEIECRPTAYGRSSLARRWPLAQERRVSSNEFVGGVFVGINLPDQPRIADALVFLQCATREVCRISVRNEGKRCHSKSQPSPHPLPTIRPHCYGRVETRSPPPESYFVELSSLDNPQESVWLKVARATHDPRSGPLSPALG